MLEIAFSLSSSESLPPTAPGGRSWGLGTLWHITHFTERGQFSYVQVGHIHFLEDEEEEEEEEEDGDICFFSYCGLGFLLCFETFEGLVGSRVGVASLVPA